MENKIFNLEEEKCIRKMFKLASLTKYSIIAVLIYFIPLLLFIINDFIRYENNVTGEFLSKKFYSALIIMGVLLIIWAIAYIILKKNLLNNKIWQNILEKVDNGENVNEKVEDINANIKSMIPAYLLGDLISLSKDLKEIGNTIKTISGIAVIALVIKSCSIIIRVIKNISKVYNVSLKFNYKLCFIIFIIPSFIIIVLDIASVIKDINNGNNLKNKLIDSLKETCEQKSYCKSISYGFGHDLKIEFNNEEYRSYSDLKLNENKKIDGISTYISYSKNTSKEDIVEDVNKKLSQLTELINLSNGTCTYDFVCKEYQLSDEFINKFYNMSDNDIEGSDTRYYYKLQNLYMITTYAYIKTDENSKPTDEILIHFSVER